MMGPLTELKQKCISMFCFRPDYSMNVNETSFTQSQYDTIMSYRVSGITSLF